jgi:hypothetical protein
VSRLPIPFHALGERPARALRGASSSLSEALVQAWHDTLGLLVRPFDAWRWVKLSAVCLVLGGGTPTAAFNWTIGILPKRLPIRAWVSRFQVHFAQHTWLLIPALAVLLLLALSLLYVRAQGRFILVDAVIRREIRIRRAWRWNRWLARSYFLFLLALLAVMGSVFGAMAIASFPYLQSGASQHSWTFPLMLVLLLGSVILLGVLSALAITLTDDFVVPLMYAERLPFVAAWNLLLGRMREEPATFAIYVLVRVGLAVLIGAAALLLLFPTLLAIFSGAVLAGSLGLLSLRAIGTVWAWNAATVTLALVAATILSGVLLVALSVASMPGQVFLQNFAIRFASARFPSLGQFLDAQGGVESPPASPAI